MIPKFRSLVNVTLSIFRTLNSKHEILGVIFCCSFFTGYSQDSVSSKVEVVDVYKWNAIDEDEKYSAGIGDIIVVKIKGLKTLLNKSQCVDEAGKCTKQEIRLFIDGRMIKDISPESGAPQKDEGTLQFHLQRNVNNDEAWADILGAPRLGIDFYYRKAIISVGLENDFAEGSNIPHDFI
jgi:hypothetical protein